MKDKFYYLFIVIIVFHVCYFNLQPDCTGSTILATNTDTHEEYKDWPISYGDALIAAWEDDKTAAFAITIDDNQGQDVAWWSAKGTEYNLKFTWFLITDKISESVTTGVGGYWDQYRQLYSLGHDIQSHTLSHLNDFIAGTNTLEQEYADSITAITSQIPGSAVEVLVYPGGHTPDPNDPDIAMAYYIGARGVVNHINNESFDYTDCYAISSVADIEDSSKNWIYAQRLYDPTDVKFRGFICMYFHDISLGSDAEENVQQANRILTYCSDHRANLWIGLFRNIIKYAKERDAVEATNGLTITTSSAEKIELNLTTGGTLDNRHDYPLTIKLKVASDWINFSATQNGSAIESSLIEFEDNYYIYLKAIPDAGRITVKKVLNKDSFSWDMFLPAILYRQKSNP